MKVVKLAALMLVLVIGVGSVSGSAAASGREFKDCTIHIEQPYQFMVTPEYMHWFFYDENGPCGQVPRLRDYDTAVQEVVAYWNDNISLPEKNYIVNFINYVLERGVLGRSYGSVLSCRRALLQYVVAVIRKERLGDDYFKNLAARQKFAYLCGELCCTFQGDAKAKKFAEAMHNLRAYMREYVEGLVLISALVDEHLDPGGAARRRREAERANESSEGGWCIIS